jgi:hypothetical protein
MEPALERDLVEARISCIDLVAGAERIRRHGDRRSVPKGNFFDDYNHDTPRDLYSSGRGFLSYYNSN